MTIDHLPSRILRMNGAEYLFFSGTSYLGMGHQPEFRAALLEGIDRYGTVFSASRNNNLQLKIYDEAEDFIAQWTGAEAALTVSSGFAAGQLVVQSLVNQKFIYAPSAHPAIWHPTAPPQYKKEISQSEGVISNHPLTTTDTTTEKITSLVEQATSPIVIAANAIDHLHLENYDFSWIKNLPSNKQITLLFDDSHGIGVTYTEGVGIFSKIKKLIGEKSNIQLIVIASLAKAVGLPGGVILSDKKTIAAIRQNPLFVGASPMVPAYLFAFLKSQNVYTEARRVLSKNIEQFMQNIANPDNFGFGVSDFITLQPKSEIPKPKYTEGVSQNDMKGTGMTFIPNYPVFLMQNGDVYEALLKEKIFISSFAYPKPSDPPITRIVLSALHTEEDIFFLSEKLKNH